MYIFFLSLWASGARAFQVPPPRVESDMEPIYVTQMSGHWQHLSAGCAFRAGTSTFNLISSFHHMENSRVPDRPCYLGTSGVWAAV